MHFAFVDEGLIVVRGSAAVDGIGPLKEDWRGHGNAKMVPAHADTKKGSARGFSAGRRKGQGQRTWSSCRQCPASTRLPSEGPAAPEGRA